MMNNIKGSIWFTQMTGQTIGIVVIASLPVDKAYIGLGKGFNEKEDEQYIANRGTPFPLNQAKELCGGT